MNVINRTRAFNWIIKEPERANNANIALILTNRCQMACRYCFIKRSGLDMHENIFKKSINLLLTAPYKNLELQFFGGEPLLRFDLIKESIEYAQKREKAVNKKVHFLLTTNGLLLDREKIIYCKDHGVNILFSFDGIRTMHSKNRPSLNSNESDSYDKILSHLRCLINSKAGYFVNITFLPEDIPHLKDSFLFLVSLEIKDIQFSYALGADFGPEHISLYKNQLKEIKEIARKQGIRFRNLYNDQEPILSTPQINIDPEGRVFIGCSAVLTQKFPEFNQLFYVDHIKNIRDISLLKRTKTEQMKLLFSQKKKLPSVLLKNFNFGLETAVFLKGLAASPIGLPIPGNHAAMAYKNLYSDNNTPLSFSPPLRSINSIMLMVTTACQMRCSYCEVKLGSKTLSEKVVCEAVDLVLTTKEPVCQVRFWGGEPLLRWDLIQKGLHYGQDQASRKNKKIKFMITTNGLLLEKNKIAFLKERGVEIMFSLDGDLSVNTINRKHRRSHETGEKLFENLKNLVSSGIDYFINLVVSPNTVDQLSQNIVFLRKTGVRKIQLCYQCGIHWPKERAEKIFKELNKLGYVFLNGFLMNLFNRCEPTMLSQEILIYPDGKIYFDAAIFLEKKFPALKESFCLGEIKDIKSIDALFKTKTQLYRIFYDSCSFSEKKIFKNNIGLGLKLDSFMKSFPHSSLESNEHPQLIPIIKSGFKIQNEKLSALGIDAVFSFIEGPCGNDCLFCKKKTDLPFDDLFIIEQKLRMNLKSKTAKLCFIGNEPLLHPDIINLVKIAKKNCFKEIEILTSGELLSNRFFLKQIIDAGASSFSMPIFASSARLHDYITGHEGSYEKLLEAIYNIREFGSRIFLHTNLLKHNIDDMLHLQHLVKDILNLPFVILPIRSKTANQPFKKLMPSYEEIKNKLSGTSSLLGFPLCVTRHVQNDIFLSSREISDSMKLYFLDQKFIKAKKCSVCFYLNKCTGFFKEGYDIASSKHINPIKNDGF